MLLQMCKLVHHPEIWFGNEKPFAINSEKYFQNNSTNGQCVQGNEPILTLLVQWVDSDLVRQLNANRKRKHLGYLCAVTVKQISFYVINTHHAGPWY